MQEPSTAPQSDERLGDPAVMELIGKAFVYALPERAGEVDRLNLDASIADLGIESVAALEMAGYIEEELDIQFPDDDLASLNKIRDLVALIRRHAA